MSNRPQCAHLHIERRRTETTPGTITAEWWECRDCGTHFAPLPRFPEAAPEPKLWTSGYAEPEKTRRFIDEAPEILRRFNERIGFSTPSAPAEPVDTRCSTFGNLGRCMLDIDHPGGHQFYAVQPLAGARPEAETCGCTADTGLTPCVLPLGHEGPHRRHPGCPRCEGMLLYTPAEREFLRALAEWVNTGGINGWVYPKVRDAARNMETP